MSGETFVLFSACALVLGYYAFAFRDRLLATLSTIAPKLAALVPMAKPSTQEQAAADLIRLGRFGRRVKSKAILDACRTAAADIAVPPEEESSQ